MFHLGLSLVPPSQLTLLKLVGMQGDRKTGLLALRYCLERGWGELMEPRAPFALLGLLWYYTYVRPSMTISNTDRKKSQVYAKTLMKKYVTSSRVQSASNRDLSKSVLFIVVKGRMLRNSGKLSEGANLCLTAVTDRGQEAWMKELNQILNYEAALCEFCELKFSEVKPKLLEIHEQTRWSKVNYLYPAVLCMGNELLESNSEASLKDLLEKLKKIKETKVR